MTVSLIDRARTKTVATVGPACSELEMLTELIKEGVDVFRVNMAHGSREEHEQIIEKIRQASHATDRPVAILIDLAGPKIRLGELQQEEICCQAGGRFQFVREPDPDDITKLTCTYEKLIDDVSIGDRIMLADGTVSMRVMEKPPGNDCIVCVVEHSGCIRSRQGVNLPGTYLSTPSLTDKDRDDLAWALEHGLDYVGLSFVRSADDIRLLRSVIEDHQPAHPPQIIAKIEKMEAVNEIESILDETDAVMVARGDLGVEVDIARVP
ncbi:MAG: pyruvate kinase, partial [Planctomycetes bacterium]|nr:pyruvate kinase [Planctomycetota bacterium]